MPDGAGIPPNGVARVAVLVLLVAGIARAGEKGDPADFLGTWRGTSTCVDRKVAPACKDETVIYEVRRADKAGAVILEADKVVGGERLPMGELEFTYSGKDGCWRSEFTTPRTHGVWCLVVEGRKLTGTLRVLPENADVRKVEAVRE